MAYSRIFIIMTKLELEEELALSKRQCKEFLERISKKETELEDALNDAQAKERVFEKERTALREEILSVVQEIERVNGIVQALKSSLEKASIPNNSKDYFNHIWRFIQNLSFKEQHEVVYQISAQFARVAKRKSDSAENAYGFYKKIESQSSDDFEKLGKGHIYFDPNNPR